MTEFRSSQARLALEGLVRALAPHTSTRDAMYLAVCELAQDHRFWAERRDEWTARRKSVVQPEKFDESRKDLEQSEAGHA